MSLPSRQFLRRLYDYKEVGEEWARPVIDRDAVARRSLRLEIEGVVNLTMRDNGFIEKREVCEEMGAKLSAIGQEVIGDKVSDCFSVGRVEVYEKGSKMVPFDSCGYGKLCPIHAQSETRRRVYRYYPLFVDAAADYKLKFLTLTVPNVEVGSLAAGVRELWASWMAFRRSSVFASVEGALVNIELTWSFKHGNYNVHLHSIVAYRKSFDVDAAYIKRCYDRWHQLTGSQQINFKHIKKGEGLEKSLVEVLKYTSKFKASASDKRSGRGGGLLDMPIDAFAEWFDVFHGARTFRSYGMFFGAEEKEFPERELGRKVCDLQYECSGGQFRSEVFLIHVDKSTISDALEVMRTGQQEPFFRRRCG